MLAFEEVGTIKLRINHYSPSLKLLSSKLATEKVDIFLSM